MIENLDKSSDLKVWNFAFENKYTIVTKDSDFNDLVVLKGYPPKVIWIGLGNCRVDDIVTLIMSNLQLISDFLTTQDSGILKLK